jgi:hypothetical protein
MDRHLRTGKFLKFFRVPQGLANPSQAREGRKSEAMDETHKPRPSDYRKSRDNKCSAFVSPVLLEEELLML